MRARYPNDKARDSSCDITLVKWKCRNVSATMDFRPIPGAHNSCLGTKRRREITAHMACVANKYAKTGRDEVQLLKAGALQKGTRC